MYIGIGVSVYMPVRSSFFTMNINLSANLLRGFLFTLTMALYLSNFVDYFSLSCIILCFFSALNILVIGKFLIISEF